MQESCKFLSDEEFLHYFSEEKIVLWVSLVLINKMLAFRTWDREEST
jgi:hypothetical protein